MHTRKIIGHAAVDALLTALYVVAVSVFLQNANRLFGRAEETVLIPIAMLMLLVLSAAVCGTLVFGRPIFWYLDGKKKEGLALLGYTLVFLFLATALALAGLASS